MIVQSPVVFILKECTTSCPVGLFVVASVCLSVSVCMTVCMYIGTFVPRCSHSKRFCTLRERGLLLILGSSSRISFYFESNDKRWTKNLLKSRLSFSHRDIHSTSVCVSKIGKHSEESSNLES